MNEKPLNPEFMPINQVLDCQFSVPVYQRPYSWDKDQMETLLKDIWNSFFEYLEENPNNNNHKGYYMGNIILHNVSPGYYELIDGQQRITSFSLILLALYNIACNILNENNESTINEIKDLLWKKDYLQQPDRDKPLLKLGSIEKQTLADIFDEAHSKPKNLDKYVDSYNCRTSFDERIKKNFMAASNFLQSKIINEDDGYDDIDLLKKFVSYYFKNIFVIRITNMGDDFNVFNMFESINGKGKALDDIDLIKTHIFARLDKADRDRYLEKWGKLILDTNDDLQDYLKIYIKANVHFYRANISFKTFVNLDDDLCRYFDINNLSQAYKMLIDDLLKYVDCFQYIKGIEPIKNCINNDRFLMYFQCFKLLSYEHPKPIFFRLLCSYKDSEISKKELISCYIELIKFSICFLSIFEKDSKDMITLYSNIAKYTIQHQQISFDYIYYLINSSLELNNINSSTTSEILQNADVYSKNKKLGAFILCLYENRHDEITRWSKALSLYKSYGEQLALDHIMVQTPAYDDPYLKYYERGGVLVLKDNHDFEQNIKSGMDYDLFKSLVLHRVGNLKIEGFDQNASKSNKSSSSFNKFEDIKNRSCKIARWFAENIICYDGHYSIDVINDITSSKNESVDGWYKLSDKELNPTNSTPEAIKINGKEDTISANNEIIPKITNYLCSKHEKHLIEIAKNKWVPRTRVILTDKRALLARPYEVIKDSLYVETNLSAWDTMFYSRAIVEEVKEDPSLIEIKYRW